MYTKQKEYMNYILENKAKFYRIAYAYTQNKEDALDVIQEAIYKALKTSENLDVAYIKTWFHRILVNTAIDLIRKNKKYVLSNEEANLNEQKYCDTYENIDLKTCLNTLPDEQRIVIILRYFEDLKLQEIADILDENLSTIKNRLYKALKNLKFEMTAQEVIQNEGKGKIKSIKDGVR